jgi:type II secretory pathway component GspD/PulD (secretin)
MKTTMKYFLAAICFAGFIATAGAQNAPEDANTNAAPDQAAPEQPPGGSMPDAGGATAADAPETPPSPEALAAAVAAVEAARAENNSGNSGGSTAILPTEALGTSHTAANSDFTPPLTGTNANALLMNFRNAPLDMVLNYLSDAAGFIIVLDTQVRGNVSVISNHPMTRDEAVDLLNSVLNKNGYAAIRDGRTLTIVGKDDAKTRNIPVKVEANPKNIPNNDEIVTQIIPIRFVEAEQLTKDLSPFVSAQATIVANEAGNSIVITDTQSNIKHLAEIIEAIDSSAEAETEIRVFHLKFANPTDVATELGNIFPSSSSGSSAQAPTRFGGGFGGAGGGGPGGFFQRMMGGGQGGGAGGSGSSNDRIKKATQVTAVADARIQAVIVSGPKDLMTEIAGMMKDLDVPSDRDQNVSVIPLENSDPQQVAQVLQSMFSNGSTSRSGSSSSSQNSALQTRAQNSATTMSTTTTSSGIGSSTGGGGGGSGGRAGGF